MAHSKATPDLLVIGGGINGAAIARDAAGRGLSVMLAERDDYAAATSSASSKLIHGGLRYLEQFEFSLVREALAERDILLHTAPHLVSPMRFLVPITKAQARPAWMVRAGLLLYDLLAGRRRLERSGRLAQHEVDTLPRLRRAGVTAVLHYPDCWVDDARLVLETLLDARARGADIANRREVTAIQPAENGYHVTLHEGGTSRQVHARFVVNAAGPWANTVLDSKRNNAPRRGLRLVRGSHIVLPMPQPPDPDAFTLQNDDGRVVFTIPWLDGRFLAIGTTDAAHDGDPGEAACSDAERDYLLDCYNRYFDHPGVAGPQDVVWSWAGVRPLIDDGEVNPSRVTRESSLLEERRGTGGWITLYGGKLTTHRALAEKVTKRLDRMGATVTGKWTRNAPLHGGAMNRAALDLAVEQGPGWIDLEVRRRWARTYGSEIEALFDRVASDSADRRLIAPGVYEAELEYAAEIEDARTAEDFLYRRTKLFIDLSDSEKHAIQSWFSGLAEA